MDDFLFLHQMTMKAMLVDAERQYRYPYFMAFFIVGDLLRVQLLQGGLILQLWLMWKI
jgi:hypothetical protein